jgi:hypothetical protein
MTNLLIKSPFYSMVFYVCSVQKVAVPVVHHNGVLVMSCSRTEVLLYSVC